MNVDNSTPFRAVHRAVQVCTLILCTTGGDLYHGTKMNSCFGTGKGIYNSCRGHITTCRDCISVCSAYECGRLDSLPRRPSCGPGLHFNYLYHEGSFVPQQENELLFQYQERDIQ